MAKRNGSKAQQHIGGSKGNLFRERLKSAAPDRTMIVPIEIGKSWNKAVIAEYFGSILKAPFEFHSSQEGVSFLHNTISKVATEHQAEQILVAVEATGHYYRKPGARLYQLGYDNLGVLNPLSSAQCRKGGLTWAKTDDIDLRAIGQSLLNGYGTLYRPEQPNWENLRELCRYRRFQIRHQTRLKNKIHTVLDNLLPGIAELEMFKDSHIWHPASLAFFAKYPKVEMVSRLRPHRIVECFRRRGRRLSPEHAHQLIIWPKQTFTQCCPADCTREQILKSLIAQLEQLSENVCPIEIKILDHLVRIPAVLLLSIE